jgi:hypothetical protein
VAAARKLGLPLSQLGGLHERNGLDHPI